MLRYKGGFTSNNYKQAYMPTRAIVIKNPVGTAPGFALESATEPGKYIACMPGPPREMTAMFENHLRPWLLSMSDGSIFTGNCVLSALENPRWRRHCYRLLTGRQIRQ